MRYRLPDLIGNATTINGLPTIQFSPQMYARIITSIVVTNGVASSVAVYKGQLVSVPVAQNPIGANNTLTGDIYLPAGQALFIQWSNAAPSVDEATARISLDRQDDPLEAGVSGTQSWSVNAVDSITIPTQAGPGQARMVIGGRLPPPLDTYLFWGSDRADSGIVWYQATASNDDYNFLVHLSSAFNSTVYLGHVLNGAVLENAPGIPAGMSWSYGGAGNVNSSLFGSPSAGSFNDFDNIRIAGDPVSPARESYSASTMAGGGTAAAAYANMIGPPQVTLAKHYASTSIEVDVVGTLYAAPAAAGAEIGVNVNGVDTMLSRIAQANSLLNSHTIYVGKAVVGAALPAGNYAITARWRMISGAGPLLTDVNDWIFFSAREVAT